MDESLTVSILTVKVYPNAYHIICTYNNVVRLKGFTVTKQLLQNINPSKLTPYYAMLIF